jgi:hypothetical protein
MKRDLLWLAGACLAVAACGARGPADANDQTPAVTGGAAGDSGVAVTAPAAATGGSGGSAVGGAAGQAPAVSTEAGADVDAAHYVDAGANDLGCDNCASLLSETKSLQCYCQNHACPTSLADALQNGTGRTPWTSSLPWDYEERGCGTVVLTYSFAAGGGQMFFDEATGNLIGAMVRPDVLDRCARPTDLVWAQGGKVIAVNVGLRGTCANVTRRDFNDAGAADGGTACVPGQVWKPTSARIEIQLRDGFGGSYRYANDRAGLTPPQIALLDALCVIPTAPATAVDVRTYWIKIVDANGSAVAYQTFYSDQVDRGGLPPSDWWSLPGWATVSWKTWAPFIATYKCMSSRDGDLGIDIADGGPSSAEPGCLTGGSVDAGAE